VVKNGRKDRGKVISFHQRTGIRKVFLNDVPLRMWIFCQIEKGMMEVQAEEIPEQRPVPMQTQGGNVQC
jgi:hypothetical protein